jgi:cell wall-associated NlpC family hydrolase
MRYYNFLFWIALGCGVLLVGCQPQHRAQNSPERDGYTAQERQARSRQRTYERQRKRPGYEDPNEVLAERGLAQREDPAQVRRSEANLEPERTPRTEDANRGQANAATEGAVRASAQAEKVIREARSYLGTRYQWGGMSRSGVDCSGLMVLAFKEAGVTLPRVSDQQFAFGREVPRTKLKPGDLVFFRAGTAQRIGHSGLVVEVTATEIKFIHSISSGVTVSSLNDPHWKAHYISACRVLE